MIRYFDVCKLCGATRKLTGKIGNRSLVELDDFGFEKISGYWEVSSGSYCKGHVWRRMKKGEYK